jgi:hypothetical protein
VICIYVQDQRERELPKVGNSWLGSLVGGLCGLLGGAAAGLFAGLLGAAICGGVGLVLGVLIGMWAGSGCFYAMRDYNGNETMIWNGPRSRRQYAANWKRHEANVTSRLNSYHCAWVVVSTEEGDAAIPKVFDLFAGHA